MNIQHAGGATPHPHPGIMPSVFSNTVPAAAAMVASAAWREEGRRACGGVGGDSRDDNHWDGADDL